MDYMTLKEAAENWSVTPRRVNYYCAGGRIPGAVKMAGVWLIPKTAEKPIDGRTKQGKEQKHFYFRFILVSQVIKSQTINLFINDICQLCLEHNTLRII